MRRFVAQDTERVPYLVRGEGRQRYLRLPPRRGARTTGDYFSGRHLPPDGRPEQLSGILRACGETEPAELARWMSALQRARRPPGRRPGGADAPYRGLARFEREDARWFFGREDVTDLLAAMTDEEKDEGKQQPLILVGPSGAGKSS